MGHLDDFRQKTTDKIIEIGLNVGDFVCLSGWFGDVWAEVETAHLDDGSSCSVVVYDGIDGHDVKMTFVDYVTKIHRKGDPWDHLEVRIMHCKEGICGRHKGGGNRDIKFLDKFKYHGTFKIEAWLWNYRGKNCTPKQKKNLDDFAKVINLPITGIPWDLCAEVCDQIGKVVIDGWRPICRGVAEQQFKKTIVLGD